MQLEQLAIAAEVFGMIVVAITLVFLTIQMRQNTKALRSTTAQSANDMALAIYDPLVLEAEVSDVMLRGLRDPGSLNEVEMARFTSHWQRSFFAWQNWYYQRKQGGLDDGIWLGFSKLLSDVFRTPGLQDFWRQRGHYFSDEFRAYLDKGLPNPTVDYRVLGTQDDERSPVA